MTTLILRIFIGMRSNNVLKVMDIQHRKYSCAPTSSISGSGDLAYSELFTRNTIIAKKNVTDNYKTYMASYNYARAASKVLNSNS